MPRRKVHFSIVWSISFSAIYFSFCGNLRNSFFFLVLGIMFNVSRRAFFQIWHQSVKKNSYESLLTILMENYQVRTVNKETQARWKVIVCDFSKKIKERWEKSGRKMNYFLKYADLLDGDDLIFQMTINDCTVSEQPRSSGRPPKPFEEVKYRSKKKKVQYLLSSSVEELTFATEVALRGDGKRDAANLIKEISSASPNRSTQIKLLRREKENKNVRQYSRDEALALYVDCRLTKQSYIHLRKSAREAGHFLYPSYIELQKAKNECSPLSEFISVCETKAEIDLQALLDHTAQRLSIVQESVLKQFASTSIRVSELLLISK